MRSQPCLALALGAVLLAVAPPPARSQQSPAPPGHGERKLEQMDGPQGKPPPLLLAARAKDPSGPKGVMAHLDRVRNDPGVVMADFVNVEYGGNHPIDIATMNGNVEVVKVLAQHGADLSLKGQNGQTPLHLSAWKGNAEVGEVLLRAGA